jgi:hypothetical protein
VLPVGRLDRFFRDRVGGQLAGRRDEGNEENRS